MKRNILSFTLLLTTVLLLTACLGNTEEDRTTYYDSAITTFKIGKLNKYVTTTDSTGKPKVNKTTIDGSKYSFYIDQANRVIYNPDSLPPGLDIKRVVATCTTKNGGVVTIKSMKSDSIFSFSSKDSIDFSEPRTLIVYNQNGSVNRTYTVKVNMHKQTADQFDWTATKEQNTQIAALSDMKLIAFQGKMILAGKQGGEGKLYMTTEQSMTGWEELTTNIPLSPTASTNLVATADKLYLLNNDKLYTSSNGTDWEEVATPTISKLIGASATKLYGLTAANAILCSADGSSWKNETMDGNIAFMPTQNITMISQPTKVNEDINYLVLVGNRAESFTTDSTACVWGKVEDNGANAATEPWSYYPIWNDNYYKAPRLANLQIAGYGSSIIAFGGDGLGAHKGKAFSAFYVSNDKGITWKKDKGMKLPDTFSCDKTRFAMAVDSQNFIWIVCGGSGKVWKGRHAGKGWTSEPKTFEK